MDTCTLTIEVSESAGTGETWYATVPHAGTWKLQTAYFVPDTTTGTNAANYTTLALRDAGDAANVGALTTNSSGGAALTAGTPSAFTLSGDLEYAGAGAEVVKVTKTDASSGAALEGRLVLGFAKFRAG